MGDWKSQAIQIPEAEVSNWKSQAVTIPEEKIEGPTYTMKSGEKIPIMTGFPLAAALPEAILEMLPAAASDVGSTGGILSKVPQVASKETPGLLSKASGYVSKKTAPAAMATAVGVYLAHKMRGLLR